MNSPSLAARPLLIVMNNDWFSTSAVGVTMANLLQWLTPDEFVIACAKSPRSSLEVRRVDNRMRIHPVLRPPITGASWRLDEAIAALYFRSPLPSRAVQRLARMYNCGTILAPYPNVRGVVAAQKAAARLGLPLAIYLHDTIAEGAQGSHLHSYARKLQAELFSGNHFFFSMSEGLAELLLTKYGLRAVPLPHCYNETPSPPRPLESKSGPRTALFSGSVYGINRFAVVRLAKAAVAAGYRIVCTVRSAAESMIAARIPATSVTVKSLPTRSEYLAFLREQDVLFVGLSGPHESAIHRDELATIFPTKVPEYLGAGRPILVHCPDDYFLARFVRTHECGLVVSETSEEALLRAWTDLRDDPHLALRLARNGYQAASYFDGQRIAALFRQHMEALIAARSPSSGSTDTLG